MGQYHGIYNKTKKEYFSIGGAKLWEKSSNSLCSMGLMVLLCNSNGRGGGDLNNPIHARKWHRKTMKPLKKPEYENSYTDAPSSKAEFEKIESALKAVSGRWAGDEIVIQGDYAKETDPAFVAENQFDDFEDITPLVVKAFELTCFDDDRVMKSISVERQFSRGRF